MSEENIEYLKESCKNQFGFEQDKIITYNEAQEIVKYLENLKQENKHLKEQVTIMEKYLELIVDLSLDYDGCNTVESLKGLIDELERLAMLGRVCNTTKSIYTNSNKTYNILNEEIKGDSNE